MVNTIAGEARLSDPAGVDAVINTMINRVGSKGYGPSENLLAVARAKGQFAGYNKGRPTPEQAQMIRDRIRALASGQEADNTGGATEFRTSTYTGPWMQKHGRTGIQIGGNTFGANSTSGGPYQGSRDPNKAGEPRAVGYDPTMTMAGVPASQMAAMMAQAGAGTAAASRGGGGVAELQGKEAGIRKQAITKGLKQQLEYAGLMSGVNVQVYSGGQDEHGPNRTGSHRHDKGKSADFRMYDAETGKLLDLTKPADRKKIEEFTARARQAGVTGIGMSADYMGKHSMHAGGGSALTWGAGGKAANAPKWLQDAYARGTELEALDPKQVGQAIATERQRQLAEIEKEAAKANPPVPEPPTPAAKPTQPKPESPPPKSEAEMIAALTAKAKAQTAAASTGPVAGARALGGPVSRGMQYLVGEGGQGGALAPEMFMPNRRDPLAHLVTPPPMALGRGQLDVQLKLDRGLSATTPAVKPAQMFDVGVNVDTIGAPGVNRPGDPTFTPPRSSYT